MNRYEVDCNPAEYGGTILTMALVIIVLTVMLMISSGRSDTETAPTAS